ncbi:hypothetical protein M413DRAFT_299207 [Hebeloma cylindrosporum]|uniref:Uncharacterized protein n=1 Tax=Hebeloma cylindrosporum TaxID=76867 RepID=A0A0C2Y7Y7_HEBCY|nr:hypothetical protein M413DRAFT_299207 [Hebeloma cylindrosporum h7]
MIHCLPSKHRETERFKKKRRNDRNVGNEGDMVGREQKWTALKKGSNCPGLIRLKKSQGPMAEVGRVVTVWVKYMGVTPDKIVLLVRGRNDARSS